MILGRKFLANRSEVKNPGGFAKFVRTLKIEYFLIFVGSDKQFVAAFWRLILTPQIEVCQNSVWKPVAIGFSGCRVANLESRSTGLKQVTSTLPKAGAKPGRQP